MNEQRLVCLLIQPHDSSCGIFQDAESKQHFGHALRCLPRWYIVLYRRSMLLNLSPNGGAPVNHICVAPGLQVLPNPGILHKSCSKVVVYRTSALRSRHLLRLYHLLRRRVVYTSSSSSSCSSCSTSSLNSRCFYHNPSPETRHGGSQNA